MKSFNRRLARRSTTFLTLCLSALVVGWGAIPSAWATTYTVSNTNNTGTGSLRQAITSANASISTPHSINFNSSVSGTIQLTSALPALTRNTTINGSGANKVTVRRNVTTDFRIFQVSNGTTVTINKLTIANGSAPAGGNGGGLYNTGTTTINDCAFVGNVASGSRGGGIYNDESNLSINRCLFQNNSATDGGGINSYNSGGNSTAVSASTFSGNTATSGYGGGYRNENGTSTLESCTIVGNTAPADNGSGLGSSGSGSASTIVKNCLIVGNANSDDVSGPTANPFSSQGYNIVGFGPSVTASIFNGTADQRGVTLAAAKLSTLRDNGGPTLSFIPLSGSPALDKGSETAIDQRGVARPYDSPIANATSGNGADVGAIEVNETYQTGSILVVNTSADTNDGACGSTNCTLREAIQTANQNGSATISFASGVTQAIQLESVLPDLNANITINGPGAQGLTVRRNSDTAFRIFHVLSGRTVSISGLTIADGSSIYGAGLYNEGTLTLTNCVLSGNATSSDGGGAYNEGIFTATGCTFNSNTADAGGGLYSSTESNLTSSSTTIRNCTFSGNTATDGGGLYNYNGLTTIESSTFTLNSSGLRSLIDSDTKLLLKNSLIVGNSEYDTYFGSGAPTNLVSQGYNALGTGNLNDRFNQTGDQINVTAAQAALAPLALNGGTTPTHALLNGSVGIDRGSATGTDQRGVTRPFDVPGIASSDNGADVGAFEVRVPILDLDGSTAGLNFSASFTESSTPVFSVDTDAFATAGENANISGTTVTLTNRPDGTSEILAINVGSSGLTASTYNPATGVLSLSGSALPSVYAQVLSTLTYNNTSENPAASTRTITIALSDGTYTSPVATSTVTVTSVNDAPVNTIPGAQSTPEDTPLIFSAANNNAVSVSDFDADALNITLSVNNGTLSLSRANGLNFSVGDGSGDAAMAFSGSTANVNAALDGLVFTPAVNTSGGSTLTLLTSDGGNTGTGGALTDADSVAITITPVNDAPVAADDQVGIDEDTSVLVDVRANDIDIDSATLSVAAVTPGANTHGTLAIEDNKVRFTPEPNYNGPSTWTYTVSDGALSSTATVTVTVRAINDAPVVQGDDYTLTGLAPLSVAAPGVLTNDADGDGEILSAVALAQPTHGTLNLNPDGSFIYTPTSGFNGRDSFTYRATDVTSQSQPATVTITVGSNPAPAVTLSLYTGTVREGGSITGTLTLSRPTATNFAVLLSSNSAAVKVPASVQVLAGQSSATFVITTPRNLLATGTLNATITANAGGYGTSSALLSVSDLEVAALKLAVAPTVIGENFGPAAAIATITRNTPVEKPLIVRLTNSNVRAIRVPSAVVIPTGTNSISFFVAALDNRLVNAAQSVRLDANATGLRSASTSLRVNDNGRVSRDLRLFVESGGRFTERVGGQVATGTLTLVGTPLTSPVAITLASSDPRRIAVPATVILPAGKTSINFSLRVLDNTIHEASARVFITARTTGYGSAFVETVIADDDGPSLVLALGRASVSEGVGSFTATVTRRNVPITSATAALAVSLQSSNRALVSVPASVIIPRGRASVTFPVRVIANTLVDSTRRITLSAAVSGLGQGVATLDVLDDDAHPRATGTDEDGTVATSPVSSVHLSTASSWATGQTQDQVQLVFTGALDADMAQDSSRYKVNVNGEVVEVEIITYPSNGVATLYLPEGTLKTGDKVQVRWRLSDVQGLTVEGSTDVIAAR